MTASTTILFTVPHAAAAQANADVLIPLLAADLTVNRRNAGVTGNQPGLVSLPLLVSGSGT